MSMVSDDWKDGASAARDGEFCDSCPHPAGTRSASDWRRGWKSGERLRAFIGAQTVNHTAMARNAAE